MTSDLLTGIMIGLIELLIGFPDKSESELKSTHLFFFSGEGFDSEMSGKPGGGGVRRMFSGVIILTFFVFFSRKWNFAGSVGTPDEPFDDHFSNVFWLLSQDFNSMSWSFSSCVRGISSISANS